MCNCAAGKKWKRSAAWFPSYRAKCVADAERNFSTKRNAFTIDYRPTEVDYLCFYVAMVNFNVSVYYRVTEIYTCSCKKSRQRQLGKTAVVNAGAYIVSMDRKTTVYGLEAGKITFFEKRVQAVHSNVFPYFTALPVSSSL